MGNLRLNAGVPWLSDKDGGKCFICKMKDASHFFFDCMSFGKNFTTILWSNLKTRLFNANRLQSNFMFSFLVNLDRKHKIMFLLGGLSLPFDIKTSTIVKRFVSTTVGKICKNAPISYVIWRPVALSQIKSVQSTLSHLQSPPE